MNLRQYQEQAARTCPDLGSKEANVQHMRLGVFTEVGEFLDMVKRHLVYNEKLDVVNLQEEIADICWYLVNESRMAGIIFTDKDEADSGIIICGGLPTIADVMMHWLVEYHRSGLFKVHYLLATLYGVCDALKLDFYHGLQNNIDKLRVRYPEKFTEQQAINRNVERERLELEK